MNFLISKLIKKAYYEDNYNKLVAMSQRKLKSETSNRTLPLCDAMIAYLNCINVLEKC